MYYKANDHPIARLISISKSIGTRIFGSKRDDLTGEWRKLNNEEPGVLSSSPNIVRVIKSGKI
jgi:hypothetical protein